MNLLEYTAFFGNRKRFKKNVIHVTTQKVPKPHEVDNLRTYVTRTQRQAQSIVDKMLDYNDRNVTEYYKSHPDHKEVFDRLNHRNVKGQRVVTTSSNRSNSNHKGNSSRQSSSTINVVTKTGNNSNPNNIHNRRPNRVTNVVTSTNVKTPFKFYRTGAGIGGLVGAGIGGMSINKNKLRFTNPDLDEDQLNKLYKRKLLKRSLIGAGVGSVLGGAIHNII